MIILFERLMVWQPKEIEVLKSLAGVYRLPGGCWAVFNVKEISTPEEKHDQLPEGVEYSWAILMPGEYPALRGYRMAGVDNADDAAVRRENRKYPDGPKHRAHRHHPDWKRAKMADGREWPLSGDGERLTLPPSNPEDLWLECMRCLEDLFEDLGFEAPTAEKLMEAKTT